MNTIKLQSESVLQVPLQKYIKDFTFIVNFETYKTSSFVADLLSPIISSRHMIDPTINEFTINTESRGDFSKIISLIDFKPQKMDINDFPFIKEVIDQLGTEKVEFDFNQKVKITNDNIFDQIKIHQAHPQFYKSELLNEIEYFSLHFYELSEKVLEKIRGEEFEFNDEVFESIINNSHLVLGTEDDLLKIVNEMYKHDRSKSQFYEFIDFKNVELSAVNEFIQIFDINDLNASTWSSICERLQHQIHQENKVNKHECMKKNLSDKIHQENKANKHEFSDKINEFKGIMNYLKTNFNIKDELNITSSLNPAGNPFELLNYDNKMTSSYFETKDPSGFWFCFEFKKHQVIPSSYIIRSFNYQYSWHPKNWVFEGSNDNNDWSVLDIQQNNNSLNGANRVKSFSISNDKRKPFKYLRIRQTGLNWSNNNGLILNSIEFYGKLI